METAWTQSPIGGSALGAIFTSDQDMYPWVSAWPELSICFSAPAAHQPETSGSPQPPLAGVIVVLPLRRAHWEDLLVGRIKEADIDAETMFPARLGVGVRDNRPHPAEEGGEEVGLHVFLIERFAHLPEAGHVSAVGTDMGATKKRFAEFALDQVARRAAAIGRGERRWGIAGFSGEPSWWFSLPVYSHFLPAFSFSFSFPFYLPLPEHIPTLVLRPGNPHCSVPLLLTTTCISTP
ncbi:hypothetical protein B0T26DRAFT_700640 [Lasiosphaeria miniovina]|uniref:Uncharacterized protein n=1 Tax=Lasiosphaeria miniovina TaxID=1954250 RepID=A0AA40ATU8_9PEZI|nr:uncharacterized protein B0T26DRAFT_700640 [Lasiosphaeria miniovina]KAK0721907.1 hypothetical protein B0T26DRAFT_700640 [Lasiosphaeria miniovina]